MWGLAVDGLWKEAGFGASIDGLVADGGGKDWKALG